MKIDERGWTGGAGGGGGGRGGGVVGGGQVAICSPQATLK